MTSTEFTPAESASTPQSVPSATPSPSDQSQPPTTKNSLEPGDEQRQDRWIAIMFLFFGILFALILLWEPIRCWLQG